MARPGKKLGAVIIWSYFGRIKTLSQALRRSRRLREGAFNAHCLRVIYTYPHSPRQMACCLVTPAWARLPRLPSCSDPCSSREVIVRPGCGCRCLAVPFRACGSCAHGRMEVSTLGTYSTGSHDGLGRWVFKLSLRGIPIVRRPA